MIGKIAAVQIGREVRIPITEVERFLGEQRVLLARTGQKTLTLTEIGSGLGTERKGLQRLLALVQDYQVAEVAVTLSDRLTRFGLSYLQTLFSGSGVTLTMLAPDEDQTPVRSR